MGKQFEKSIAWLTGFIFLSLMVFAGPGFANESGQEDGDSAQRVNEYSAGDCCDYSIFHMT